jgi:dienelactone hydrolase
MFPAPMEPIGMKTILAVAVVMAAAGLTRAAEPANEGGASMREQEVTYQAGNLPLKGYLVTPAGATASAKKPGVLVVHEWWGNNDYSKMRARKFAELGYTALAVDMFGDGKQASDPEQAKKLAGEVYGNPQALLERFKAGLDFLEKQPGVDPSRIIAVGYCFGGGVALAAARAGLPLDVVGSFHGNIATKTPAKAGQVKAKIFVANGGADKMVRPEDVMAFEREMKDAKVDFELVSYPGALHAFTNPKATEAGKKFNMPIAYDEQADKKSWSDFQAFLKKHL